MSIQKKQKIIVIAGPTSTGKTDLSVILAKKLGGEVISADSRQVYRGLDLGSGKVKKAEMKGVPHHLLNVADPKKIFEASAYVRLGRKAIKDIASRGHVPIVVGGTGFYIDALLGEITLPEVPPNKKLRTVLEKKTLVWLQERLKKLDPERYKTIDVKNPVRLIRAIEIATELGKVPEQKKQNLYDVLYIVLALPMADLEKKIRVRLFARIRGIQNEVKKLHKNGLSYTRMEALGLEYRYMARHLTGKLSENEMTRELELEIVRYAKRQMTWFKKRKDIRWFKPTDAKGVLKTIQDFLKR